MPLVGLRDRCTISVPFGWFPRLQYANNEELLNWKLIAKGHGIHFSQESLPAKAKCCFRSGFPVMFEKMYK